LVKLVATYIKISDKFNGADGEAGRIKETCKDWKICGGGRLARVVP
jgi:hypothetical protein